MLASELIGVQPLDGPSGTVFYMNLRYKPTFMQSVRAWVGKQAA